MDKDKNEIIVKVINTLVKASTTRIDITGLKIKKFPTTAEVITLDCSNYDAENVPGKTEVVSPQSASTAVMSDKGTLTLSPTIPAKTFQIFKITLL